MKREMVEASVFTSASVVYTGKDSLLDVGQLTTRDWTSADSS